MFKIDFFNKLAKNLPRSLPNPGSQLGRFLALTMQMALLDQLKWCWSQYGEELRKQAKEATRHHEYEARYAPNLRVLDHQTEARFHQGEGRHLLHPI